MFSKFIIIALVHLRNGCNAHENVEYTYQANAVSEAAEQMTVYWNGETLIGGQQFEVLTMPADVAPILTDQQFVVIKKLDHTKSYEFTVFLINGDVRKPIAYTRGQVLSIGSNPKCRNRCDANYKYILRGFSDELGKVVLQWSDQTYIFTETERFLLETTPPHVPQIITDKSVIVFDKLQPETSYKFKVNVRDVNGILKTPPAEYFIKTLPQEDNNPTDLTAIVVSPYRIDLEWKAAPNANCKIMTYSVQCTSHPGIPFTTTNTRFIFQQLLPQTLYAFSVHSQKADGTYYPGAPKVEKITWSPYTYSPRDVTAIPLGPTSLRLSWTAAVESYRTPTLYKVVTNSDKKNAPTTDLTTIDIQDLSPSTDYIFEVHATQVDDSLIMPGAEQMTRTPEIAANNPIH